MADVSVDARGLLCPLPLLKARKALSEVEIGQVVEVLATDAGSLRDFSTFCDLSGNRLLLADAADGEYRYLIEKAPRKIRRADA